MGTSSSPSLRRASARGTLGPRGAPYEAGTTRTATPGALASTKVRGSSLWMMTASAARHRRAWSAAARAPPSRGMASWAVITTGTRRAIRRSTAWSIPGTTSVCTCTTSGRARRTARNSDAVAGTSSPTRSA